jgi:hypothetical protein
MVDDVRPDSKIIYQECGEGCPEPALLISQLNDGQIEIHQENRWILINRESVPEFCKLLKQMIK